MVMVTARVDPSDADDEKRAARHAEPPPQVAFQDVTVGGEPEKVGDAADLRGKIEAELLVANLQASRTEHRGVRAAQRDAREPVLGVEDVAGRRQMRS